MFEISWSEILILGVVALIFVGPKDMPVLLRTIGRYVGAIKRQAGEFRAQLDVVLKEADLDQARKELEAEPAPLKRAAGDPFESGAAFDEAVRAAAGRGGAGGHMR